MHASKMEQLELNPRTYYGLRTRLDNLIFTSPEPCAFHMKLVLILHDIKGC